MLVQLLINFVVDMIVGLLEVVNPSLTVGDDSAFGGIDAVMNAIGDGLVLVDPFIPAVSVGVALAQTLATVGFLMVVWLGRFVVSIATGGGGNG